MMNKIHRGDYGPHMSDHTLNRKIIKKRFYWSTLQSDCNDHVHRSNKCQIYAQVSDASSEGIVQHGSCMALCHLGDRHYLEYIAEGKQWTQVHTRRHRLFHQVGRSRVLQNFEH